MTLVGQCAGAAGILGLVFLAVVVLDTVMEWEIKRRDLRDAKDEQAARVRRRERGL